jgi:hypothetical protein
MPKSKRRKHAVSWLTQVDLTKYTEQHEFYFDEVMLPPHMLPPHIILAAL